MKAGETGQADTPLRCPVVPVNSRGTPGRPKARALTQAVRVHVRRAAPRKP
jgi:hypothetical protein